MKLFPLVRNKVSNEHILTALTAVLLMYQIPVWVAKPIYVVKFIILMAFGLLIDTVWNTIRYKRFVCSASVAVTVSIIEVLFADIPLWGGLVGVAAALVIGKQIWGGTGKNIFNPAMIGTLVVVCIFPNSLSVFPANNALIPAMLFSLPFILFRPYASIGLMAGMLLSMGLNNVLNISNTISFGVVFWGCIIITDPVTVSYRPFIGALGGAALGVASIYMDNFSLFSTMTILILILNLVSYIFDKYLPVIRTNRVNGSKIKKVVPYFTKGKEEVLNYSGDVQSQGIIAEVDNLKPKDILERIRECDVVGLGGAAFPVYKKIQTVTDSDAKEKVFIINAVECDPGLIHDKWLVGEFPEEICKGIGLVCTCAKFSKVILAVKDSSNLNFPKDLEIKQVPDFYPIGAERVLVDKVSGIKLPFGIIPAKQGVLVLNVQTVFAIYEAVYLNKKAVSKYITIANLLKNEARVVKVGLGVRVQELMDSLYPGEGLVFTGGGLMQCRRVDDNDLIERTTNFIAVGNMPRYKESPQCSKCGICVKRCPNGLEVYRIAELVDKGKIDQTSRLEPQKCVSCGICSFYCLAGKNLAYKVKEAKNFQ